MRTRIITGIVILSVAACGPTPSGNTGDDDDSPTPDAPIAPPPPDPGPGCQAIDVLFVIDNSGSMGQEQENLIANFPSFIGVLDQSGLDYRVAVTTTGRDYEYTMSTPLGNIPQSIDGGDNGTMLKKGTMTKRWIEKADPDVSATFSTLANVGTSGPSDEMPLSAMRDAFEERMADGTNQGFHRPDALLAIVFLTDEEDCSYEQSVSLGFAQSLCDGGTMEPVANYVTFLDQYTGDHSRWAIAAIAGKGPGACSSSFGGADEATRLKQFVQLTGTNATMSSICDGDLSIGLMQALELFESACGGILL
jgi:hypothetical protein